MYIFIISDFQLTNKRSLHNADDSESIDSEEGDEEEEEVDQSEEDNEVDEGEKEALSQTQSDSESVIDQALQHLEDSEVSSSSNDEFDEYFPTKDSLSNKEVKEKEPRDQVLSAVFNVFFLNTIHFKIIKKIKYNSPSCFKTY